MENRPVDPGSIQGSHRPKEDKTYLVEHTRTIFRVKLSITNHIVRLRTPQKPYYTNVPDVPRSLQS